ncbi:hypothetical protein FACS189494_08440 [Spirochaetia bacterium]|nr:hypothetical protein FACS189494_08440 [Spirochaetia bacterium]
MYLQYKFYPYLFAIVFQSPQITDSGASLLIKRSGVYKLNGITIECVAAGGESAAVRIIVRKNAR